MGIAFGKFLGKLLVLDNADDLLNHLEVGVSLVKCKHENEPHGRRGVGVIHASPIHWLAKNANADRGLISVLGVAVRYGHVNLADLERRGIVLLALSQGTNIAFLNATKLIG